MKRILSCLMGVVLAVGLVPAAAFGDITSGAIRMQDASGTEATPDVADDDGVLSGRLVSSEPTVIRAGGYAGAEGADDPDGLKNVTGFYSAGWPDIGEGGVAVEFAGTEPCLTLAEVNTANWTDVSPSYVSWSQEDAAASQLPHGIAYFQPSQLLSAWQARDAARSASAMATFCVRTYGRTEVRRIVEPGALEMPGVDAADYVAAASDGEAGIDVRQLYTRQVSLDASESASGNNYSVLISTANPALVDAQPGVNPAEAGAPLRDEVGLAVRYEGTAPVIWFVNAERTGAWHDKRQAKVYPCAVNEVWGTGQHVAFYTSADVKRSWESQAVPQGEEGLCYNQMRLCVEGGACHLSEVVAITRATAQRAHPAASARFQGKTAAQIMSEMTAGYNFSGSLESNYVPEDASGKKLKWVPAKDGGWGRADLDAELHWGQPYTTDAMVKAVKERGFNTVRVPVSWFQHIYERNGNDYAIDPAWMERVHEVVDLCVANDLYVILNTHHEEWLERIDMDEEGPRAEIMEEFLAVWRQIGEEFDGYDQRLVFEGMNEPHATGAPDDREWNQPTSGDIQTVNELNAAFVELFHGEDADESHRGRLLLVSAYGGHPEPPATGNFVVPGRESAPGVPVAAGADDLVAVSVHPYTPYSFAHDNEAVTGDVTHDYTDAHRDELDRMLNWVRERFTDAGVPVVFDEFGCFYYENYDASRTAWMRQYMQRAKELGIPCVMWPMDQVTFDRVTCTWAPQSKEYLGAWFDVLEDEGIAWGSKAKVAADEHASLAGDEAVGLMDEAVQLDQTRSGEETVENADGTTTRLPATWRTSSFNVRWAGLASGDDAKVVHGELWCHEIAVEYTGTAPRIALMDSSWGKWTYVEPNAIRRGERNVAYFPALSLFRMWTCGYDRSDPDAYWDTYDLGDIGKFCVTSSGATTITRIALLPDRAAPASAEGYHVHPWNDGTSYAVESVPASCTGAGFEKRTCTEDVAHTRSRQIDALGHSEGAATQIAAPTELAEGSMGYYCTRCGELLRIEAIPKLPGASADDPKEDAAAPDAGGQGQPAGEVPGDAVLPAHVCTVSFDGAAAAKGVPAAIQVAAGATVVLPPAKPQRAHYTFRGWASSLGGVAVYQPGAEVAVPADMTLYAVWKVVTKPVYRLRDSSGFARVYTAEPSEARALKKKGWVSEGVAWHAPSAGGEKVWRLQDKKTGSNFYTTSAKKAAKMKKRGWKGKGSAFRAPASGVKVYCLKGKGSAYLYTAKKTEVAKLKASGWKSQGVAFRAEKA